ncbi:Rne/Rng family ribonuclease, partial [Polaromonas sp.]|uniref:Rne/Rng family ribonuclease n=1 Tax=Polaromonas sp. TaxID=1869339 RepID=UPI0017ECEEA6
SRRIEGEDRADLKEAMDQLEYPGGSSIIARTAGIGRSAPELQWDLNYLIKLWTAIDGAGKGGKGAFLIYQESSLVIRAIRDYFNSDIGDILFDTDDVYEQARQFMAHVMPEHEHRVKRYRDDAPLFSRFQIEHQIESAYARTVQLPSGGAIVIDHTEALVSVDVNSARAIKGGDIEETATRTNLEAADEVARQMRLRDLGGLIVIDFIDMEESRNRRDVENRLRDALRQDRARVQFGTISKFGLMEMSRQRLRPALSEGASIPCPRCGGSGHIRDTESSALQILRIIQEESLKDSTASVLCQVPVDVASFLLNEKRSEISKIEMKQRINVLLVPNKTLETPNYRLERLKHDDPRLDNIEASYKMAEEIEDPTLVTRRSQEKHNKQEPIIKGVLPDAPAPQAPPKPAAPAAVAAPIAVPRPAPVATVPVVEKGIFGWLKSLFSDEQAPVAAPVPVEVKNDVRPGEARRDARPEGRGERGERSERGGRDGRRGGRSRGEGRGEAGAGTGEARTENRPENRGEARSEGRESRDGRDNRGEGRGGERRERSPEGRAEGGRQERQERPAGENRNEGRSDNAGEAQPRSESQSREGRGDRNRRDRSDRAERPERGERIPRDAVEQDLALANQAAMAAAMNETSAPRQERVAPDADREGERQQGARGEGRSEERNDGRRERGERAGRRNDRRGDRPENGSAPAAALQTDSFDAAHPAVVAGPDEAGNPVVPASSTDIQVRPEGQDEGQDRQPRERRSRDRYGRDRRERGERNEQPVEGSATPVKSEFSELKQPQVQQERISSAIEFLAPTAPQSAVPAAPAPVPAASPRPAPVTTPAIAPAPVAGVLPKIQTYDLPLQDLIQVAQGSGLQWVNSDATKIAEAKAAMAAEVKPVQVPRERPLVMVSAEAPLVLVETKRDLGTMPLPFEGSAG